MIENRTVPTNAPLPHIVYQNVAEAIGWLAKAFGFTEHFRYGDPAEPSGAQLYLGNSWIMVRSARGGAKSPAQLGYGTQSVSIFVEDVDANYQRAKAAGAKIVEGPHETEYGEYQFAATDLDGHHWVFARHAQDMSPADWGALILSEPPHRLASLPKPRFCYLQIPAIDVHQSAAFYENSIRLEYPAARERPSELRRRNRKPERRVVHRSENCARARPASIHLGGRH